MTKICPPFRISICICFTISSLIFQGTGCTNMTLFIFLNRRETIFSYGRYDSFLWVNHDPFIDLTVKGLDGLHMDGLILVWLWMRLFICVTCRYRFICATWRIDMCDMTYLYVWHDSFIWATWLISMGESWLANRSVCHEPQWSSYECAHSCVKCRLQMRVIMCVTCRYMFLWVTWLSYMCDVTHLCVWHDSFVCLIHMCDMTHLSVCHDSFIVVTSSIICVPWLIYICEITHLCVWHDSPIYLWNHSYICLTWLIYMCDMTHLYVWYDSFVCVLWLICICKMTHLYVHVLWLIYICKTTHLYVQ